MFIDKRGFFEQIMGHIATIMVRLLLKTIKKLEDSPQTGLRQPPCDGRHDGNDSVAMLDMMVSE